MQIVDFARRSAARLLPGSERRKRYGRLYVARRRAASSLRRFLETRDRAPITPRLVDVTEVVAELEPGTLHEAFPAEHVALDPPRHADEHFARIPCWYPSPRWALEHDIAATTVIRLPAGVVFGTEGWLGPDPDRVIAGWNSYRRTASEIARGCRGALDIGVVDLPGTSASLLQLGWGNYYHWLLQDLPRLFAILETTLPDQIDRFLIGPASPFIDESLDRLEIDRSLLHEVPRPTPVLRCHSLVAANLPLHEAPTPHWAIERIREAFPAAASGSHGKRIYLERGSAQRRRVVNEDEILALLDRHGFEAVSLEGLTIADQGGVVNGAEMIVAAHGAALSNLVFANAGTRVIELIPANNPQPFFFHLARRVGADYEAIVGSEPAIRRRHEVWMNDADIVVDVRELEHALNRS